MRRRWRLNTPGWYVWGNGSACVVGRDRHPTGTRRASIFERLITCPCRAAPQAYKIMMACSACVQPLSCDEAFLDVTGLGDPFQLASRLRADIQAATGCTASVGIGHNLLIARLATKRAKPDGQCHIQEAEAASAMLVRPWWGWHALSAHSSSSRCMTVAWCGIQLRRGTQTKFRCAVGTRVHPRTTADPPPRVHTS